MSELLIYNEIITYGTNYHINIDIVSLTWINCGISLIVGANFIAFVLIGLLVTIAGYFMILKMSIIGFCYLLVYAGTISILLLFILMLINTDMSRDVVDTLLNVSGLICIELPDLPGAGLTAIMGLGVILIPLLGYVDYNINGRGILDLRAVLHMDGQGYYVIFAQHHSAFFIRYVFLLFNMQNNVNYFGALFTSDGLQTTGIILRLGSQIISHNADNTITIYVNYLVYLYFWMNYDLLWTKDMPLTGRPLGFNYVIDVKVDDLACSCDRNWTINNGNSDSDSGSDSN